MHIRWLTMSEKAIVLPGGHYVVPVKDHKPRPNRLKVRGGCEFTHRRDTRGPVVDTGTGWVREPRTECGACGFQTRY